MTAAWPAARELAHGCVQVLGGESVRLAAAAGRVLAGHLVARTALPSFDASAMDGWAVRGPGPWTVTGRVLAGDATPAPLGAGLAVEVATGAVVPRGTDGVLPYEHGTVRGGLLHGALDGPRHVRHTGEECPAGAVVLPAGSLLTPAAVGLAAALGHDVVSVRVAPTVSCLVTGSELVTSGLPPHGRIRDAVGPLLGPAVTAYGGTVVALTRLADSRAALLEALEASDTDVVVTSGSSSAGPVDHLAGVLVQLGARVLVDGVAVKPGHPQVLAVVPGGPVVIGLPGNPLAALCGVVTLLAPVLAGLRGLALPGLTAAVAGRRLEGDGSGHRLHPVRVDRDAAWPTGHSGAAMLRGAALAAAFAVVPPGPGVHAGQPVGLLALP